MGSIIGLNYQSLESVAKLKDLWNEETFNKVQVLESEALRVFNDGSRQSGNKNKR